MTTQNLIDVMESHRSIIKIELEKSTSAREFWNDLRNDVYGMSLPNSIEYQISDVMRDFGYYDNLELVNKEGRIMKRFAKFWKIHKGDKLDDSILGVIGDKLQAYVKKNSVLFLDFTDNFNWHDGQFGHRGSCWWGTYSESIPVFQDGGGWAVRFYADENQRNDNGIGRTWIMPKDNILMCFNSYGIERPQVAQALTAVFAKHNIELKFQNACIENSHDDCIPYINGGTGFVMYENEGDISTSGYHTYDIDCPYESSNTCCRCDERYDDNDGRWEDGNFYCDDCWNETFICCDNCGETCSHDEAVYVESRRYSDLCQYCAERLGFEHCDNCGEYHTGCFTTDDTGNTYCDNCQSDLHFCDHGVFENGCDDCDAEQEEEEQSETA